jgi:membrane fusion protein (multidrug efflux system)
MIRAVLSDSSRRLKPGMFLRVALVVDTRDQALVIPEEAVVTQQGRLLVFKVVDGKAIGVPVKTGLRSVVGGVSVVEIVQGLESGDMVVTAGQLKLRGTNVPVKIAEPPSAPGVSPTEPAKSEPAKAAPSAQGK